MPYYPPAGGSGPGGGITASEHAVIQTLAHKPVTSGYLVLAKGGDGLLDTATLWTDGGMTTKLRETTLVRDVDGVVQAVETRRYVGVAVVETITKTLHRDLAGAVTAITVTRT